MTQTVLLKHEDQGIVTLTLNRPESANALSRDLLFALHETLSDISLRSDVRVLIVTGSGTKAFCAGADLKERRGMDERQVRQTVQFIRSVMDQVAGLPMPVIAALNGVAFGGGLELALAADIRIAATSAKMGLTETSLAIIPGAGGTQRLPRLIGVGKAKELIYTARRISAEEAYNIGLVEQVDDAVLAAAHALAADIAANGPVAVREAKFAINHGIEVDVRTGLAIEQHAYERVIPTEDRLEGLAAFAEKRKPNYQGK